MTLIDQINALVGDRLTADKAACIAVRDGYKVTGVVMTRVAQEGDGFTGVQRCIVNLGGVRWFHDAQRWHDEIMFPEGRQKLTEVIAQRDELLEELLRVKAICLREFGNGIVNEVVIANVGQRQNPSNGGHSEKIDTDLVNGQKGGAA